MRVVLLLDRDAFEPRDPQCTRLHGTAADDNAHVANGLRSLGHDVVVMPFDDDLPAMIARLREADAEVVFNSTDQLGADRMRGAHIAALLDLLEIPYTGSGPFALALSTDKARSKQLLAQQNIPVPPFFTVVPGAKPPRDPELPLFVKPLFGGAKECIARQSFVTTRRALGKRIAFVHRAASQPAICERYIEGRELTVAVLETATELRVFPVREMLFGGSNGRGPRFATHRVMEDRRYRQRWNVTMVDAQLPAAQQQAIAASARTTFRALGLRGYGRVDLRLGADGAAYVLEVNANPAVRPPSASFLAPWQGIAYEELIAAILAASHNRTQELPLNGREGETT
ncbi:MAG: D-alanine--D-alanine ligase family protein [Thermoanaerobaculia bacterium]